MVYSFGRYERLQRATIPIDSSYFLLITLEIEEKNFDSIIMDMVLPVINESRNRFANYDNSV
jgi:hypothetical protein